MGVLKTHHHTHPGLDGKLHVQVHFRASRIISLVSRRAWLVALISTIHWFHTKWYLNSGSILSNYSYCQSNGVPSLSPMWALPSGYPLGSSKGLEQSNACGMCIFKPVGNFGGQIFFNQEEGRRGPGCDRNTYDMFPLYFSILPSTSKKSALLIYHMPRGWFRTQSGLPLQIVSQRIRHLFLISGCGWSWICKLTKLWPPVPMLKGM